MTTGSRRCGGASAVSRLASPEWGLVGILPRSGLTRRLHIDLLRVSSAY
ncbi:putative leader peptide [Streptomyces sp. NPDC058751]